jgi:glycosyltransferase involved in cell wall biosynthesis
MRVTILNMNLEGRDAIGRVILAQVRFFQRRGDQVQVYLVHAPRHVPLAVKPLAHVVGLADLSEPKNAHFAQSDLYIYHYPGRYALLDTIKTLERGAVIFYYHNVTPPELWGSSFDADVLRDSVRRVGAFAKYADWIVADSAFNADELVQSYGLDRDRIRVLPPPVPVQQLGPGPKSGALLKRFSLAGRPVILFVGRMAGNKRIDLLVEALSLVRQKVPDAVLMLVGDDRGNLAIEENVARARQRATALGIADAVIFTGSVDDLAEYYRLADVYATASLHEGFGVPPIEAMACGVPVVASRATAHPEVIGDAGLLCEPGNPADLADKIIQVLTDDALCGELVQRGLERAQEFSVESYETGWSHIVAEAAAWLPNQPYPRLRPVQIESATGAASAAAKVPGGKPFLEDLDQAADVMLRSYTVRSGLPVVGPLIVWIRRNLTSHLREPYLDPTLERQVAFNRRLVETIETLMARLAAMEKHQAELEARIAESQKQSEES